MGQQGLISADPYLLRAEILLFHMKQTIRYSVLVIHFAYIVERISDTSSTFVCRLGTATTTNSTQINHEYYCFI